MRRTWKGFLSVVKSYNNSVSNDACMMRSCFACIVPKKGPPFLSQRRHDAAIVEEGARLVLNGPTRQTALFVCAAIPVKLCVARRLVDGAAEVSHHFRIAVQHGERLVIS